MRLALSVFAVTTVTLVLGTPLITMNDDPNTYLQTCVVMLGAEKPVTCFFKLHTCSANEFHDATDVPYDHRISEVVNRRLIKFVTLTDTNVSLAYNPRQHTETLIVMVGQTTSDDDRRPILCWEITLPENTYQESGCLSLSFKNTQEHLDTWKVSPNIYEKHDDQCLADSIRPTIQAYPATRSLKLSLNLDVASSTSVTLYSGNCSSVECNGSEGGCITDIRRALLFSRVGQSFELEFNALSSEYHCARIIFPCLTGCGVFCTPTVKLAWRPPSPHPRQEQDETRDNTMIVSTATLCLLVVLLLIICACFTNGRLDAAKRRRGRRVPEQSSVEGSNECEERMHCHPTTILLLYSRDSVKFCEVMVAFRQLLEKYAGMPVYDPLDESQMEDVSRNMSGWITSRLNEPSVKVVLIVSKGAALRQRAMLNNKQVIFNEPHSLDPIFTLAIKHLHENPALSQDYSKIFPVRFADFATDNMSLSLITPHKCFVLLKHLDKLVMELLEIDPETEKSSYVIRKGCKTELNNLKKALGTMKQYRKENPDYVNFQYSVNPN